MIHAAENTALLKPSARLDEKSPHFLIRARSIPLECGTRNGTHEGAFEFYLNIPNRPPLILP
jgi:hypothetical protein